MRNGWAHSYISMDIIEAGEVGKQQCLAQGMFSIIIYFIEL
jgi:hypothetical protein